MHDLLETAEKWLDSKNDDANEVQIFAEFESLVMRVETDTLLLFKKLLVPSAKNQNGT